MPNQGFCFKIFKLFCFYFQFTWICLCYWPVSGTWLLQMQSGVTAGLTASHNVFDLVSYWESRTMWAWTPCVWYQVTKRLCATWVDKDPSCEQLVPLSVMNGIKLVVLGFFFISFLFSLFQNNKCTISHSYSLKDSYKASHTQTHTHTCSWTI